MHNPRNNGAKDRLVLNKTFKMTSWRRHVMMAARHVSLSFLEKSLPFLWIFFFCCLCIGTHYSVGLVCFTVPPALKLKQVRTANDVAKLTVPARWGLRNMAEKSLPVRSAGAVMCLLYIFSSMQSPCWHRCQPAITCTLVLTS